MAHEKRLLIDVFQAYFYRKDKDGKRNLVFMSENLTSGGITTSQENTDVRNGQGNTLFAVLPGTKDVTVNLTENVFSFEALELNTGAKERVAGASQGNSGLILKRAGKISDNELEVGVNADGTNAGAGAYARFLLGYMPQNPKELVVTIGNQEFTYEATNTPVDQQFSIVKGDGTVYDGTNATPGVDLTYLLITVAHGQSLQTTSDLKILPYVYNTLDRLTETITVNARDFAEGGELWLQTVEKDEKQRATAYVYFVFENAMPEGNFEISTVSEVQPNDMTVNMRVLANEDGELYRIVREEITR